MGPPGGAQPLVGIVKAPATPRTRAVGAVAASDSRVGRRRRQKGGDGGPLPADGAPPVVGGAHDAAALERITTRGSTTRRGTPLVVGPSSACGEGNHVVCRGVVRSADDKRDDGQRRSSATPHAPTMSTRFVPRDEVTDCLWPAASKSVAASTSCPTSSSPRDASAAARRRTLIPAGRLFLAGGAMCAVSRVSDVRNTSCIFFHINRHDSL